MVEQAIIATRPLVLASSSPRRQELIRTFGLPYRVIVSDADESVEPGLAPEQIVETLSLRKAEAVCGKMRSREPGSAPAAGIVIGSDTIVVLDGAVLGKPADEADARRMLAALQGRTHSVYTGVACIDAAAAATEPPQWEEDTRFGDIGRYRVWPEPPGAEANIAVGHTVSRVTFRPMSDREIAAYVETGEPLDKAGSYGAQGLGACFVEKIEGDFYSVMGLPLNMLYQMLLKFGVRCMPTEA
ncbi:MAG: Maf family protein [Paenibacillaceae bacterium]|nr:Maf family protein [Paenibacillaceae bacterium]